MSQSTFSVLHLAFFIPCWRHRSAFIRTKSMQEPCVSSGQNCKTNKKQTLCRLSITGRRETKQAKNSGWCRRHRVGIPSVGGFKWVQSNVPLFGRRIYQACRPRYQADNAWLQLSRVSGFVRTFSWWQEGREGELAADYMIRVKMKEGGG